MGWMVARVEAAAGGLALGSVMVRAAVEEAQAGGWVAGQGAGLAQEAAGALLPQQVAGWVGWAEVGVAEEVAAVEVRAVEEGWVEVRAVEAG